MNAYRTSCVLLALALGAATGITDVQAGKSKKLNASRGHPHSVFVDTAFAPAKVNRIPIIAFVNTTLTGDAERFFYTTFEEVLRERPIYTLVAEHQVAAEAAQKGVEKEYVELKRQWEARREFVPASLARFGAALNAQYVMGGEVSEWGSETVEWNVEGYSHSDVAALVKIYSVETGEVMWEAKDAVQLKSRLHDPRSSAGMVDDLGIQRGGSRIVPEAPPVEQAARQVAINIASTLP